MFLRIDKLQIEMPAPTEPDPNAAAAVQELLGGRFGEMSTLMNYMYQSFNFRGRDKLRQYYALISNIATEELGHIELVAASINSLLNGPESAGDPATGTASYKRAFKDVRNVHHHIVMGHGAMVANAMGQPWRGDYVFNSGNLILDLLHNFFLENGAGTHKLRVYELTDHPAARQMLGYLFVRGGVHAHAYALALEELTGVEMKKMRCRSRRSRTWRCPSPGRLRPKASTASCTASAWMTTKTWPQSGAARRSTAAARSRWSTARRRAAISPSSMAPATPSSRSTNRKRSSRWRRRLYQKAR
jgi:Mn-containing catalase